MWIELKSKDTKELVRADAKRDNDGDLGLVVQMGVNTYPFVKIHETYLPEERVKSLRRWLRKEFGPLRGA